MELKIVNPLIKCKLIYCLFTGTIGGTLSLLLGMNIINLFEILYVIIQMASNYITHMFDYN